MGDRLYGTNIKLPSLDNLFGEDESPKGSDGQPVKIPLTQLYPFKDHPFYVRDDEEMDKLVESIRDYDVLTPALVRPRVGGGYELISGHRRHHAAALAKKKEMPCIIREMTDDEAIIFMVDANVQREHIRPMEKARAYQMKLEALKRNAGRPLKNNSGQLDPDYINKRSNQIVAEDAGESVKQIQRYIRLNYLIPELQDMVDDYKLKLTPAVEISYLSPEEQMDFYEYIDSMGCTPSLSQAQKLKAASKDEGLTPERLEEIMTAQPPSVAPREPQLTFPISKVKQYFPKNFTNEQMTEQIIKLVQAYYRNRHGQNR